VDGVTMLRFLPNALCVLRMLLALPVAWLLVHERYAETFLVLGFAAVTDGLDGFLAKQFGWTSELGKILDPLADKILLVTVFITLCVVGLVPLWVAAIAVFRDIVISFGAIVYRVLYGPIDGNPTKISKFNTLCQIVYVLSIVAHTNSGMISDRALHILAILVVLTTTVSGAEYVMTYSQRAFRRAGVPPSSRPE